MNKHYNVTIPIAGAISVFVEAESEEEAKEMALISDWDIELKSEESDVELIEIDIHEHITQGNILYAPYNEIEIEEI